jgi:diacylglycerol kinase (ATP)
MTQGPRRVAVLHNPEAGRGRHRDEVAAAVRTLGTGGHEVRVLDAHTVDDALAACRRAVADGVDALVAIGGDGTVHVAIQAVAGTDVPLGIVPAGTGNDFAAEAGVAPGIAGATAAIVDALPTGRSRRIDLARVTGPNGYDQWFAAVLGAGFDAIVNERANAMRWPRGRRRYDLAIFAELVRLRARHYVIALDGGKFEQDAVLVAVGNASRYGGGLRMCPAADLTDGLLDVVVAGPISRATLLRLQPLVYKGTHVRHPAVASYRARTVEIHGDGITAYADGERACTLPITVTADPGALRLLG